MELITHQAMRAGFTGGVVVDYPNSTKAKKYSRRFQTPNVHRLSHTYCNASNILQCIKHTAMHQTHIDYCIYLHTCTLLDTQYTIMYQTYQHIPRHTYICTDICTYTDYNAPMSLDCCICMHVCTVRCTLLLYVY